jgi:uncharacterized ferritin-like protein (DUF455 family)
VRPPATLAAAALAVLTTADAVEKAETSRSMAAAWRRGDIGAPGRAAPPERPARPARPELRPPADMPKRRRGGSAAGRTALLHAIAHIELNAIDLAWDLVIRFPDEGLPRDFLDDWVGVGDDEGRHFLALSARLADLGAAYGALPAHDGLWQAAAGTQADLAARLAVVPLVLEARGLDVTPPMIESLRRAGDDPSADILQVILEDEIRHVAAGRRWFEHVCAARGVEPVGTWQDLVRRHFRGSLKRPFNTGARDRAGFAAAFYEPIAD